MCIRSSIALTLGVVLMLTAACASGSDGAGSNANAVEDYGLPEDVTEVTIGTAVGVAPYEYYEEGSNDISGYEPELLEEVAGRLGVELTWQTGEFAALFGGLDAGRFDLAANGVIDRKSRQEKYDILDYGKDASGFMGKEGTTAELETLEDVCGRSIGVHSGTSFEQFFDDQSKKCEEAGRSPIDVVVFKQNTESTIGVVTGRVDYAVSQVPLLAFAAKQRGGGLEVGGPRYLEGVVGLVFPKDSELLPVFQRVLDEMMADGTYQKILEKWDMADLAMEKTAVNSGTLE